MAQIFAFRRKGEGATLPPAPPAPPAPVAEGVGIVITSVDGEGSGLGTAAISRNTLTMPEVTITAAKYQGVATSGYGAHRGYPDPIGLPLAEVKGQKMLPRRPTVSDTAAEQVVLTLLFYAKQGMDHGVMARSALTAMGTAVEAEVAALQAND